MSDNGNNNDDFTFHVRSKNECAKDKNDKEKKSMVKTVESIQLDKLVPFNGHPFKPYGGQQLADLVESIRINGVLSPINVRSINDEKYEILAGHNRVNAAREAGLTSIPAIIFQDLTDDDAKILVVDSNFNQRSTKEMKPSELANSLHMLNEALKKRPGYRSDLEESEDGSQSANRSRTMHVIGEKHNLSQATIARFIRIAQLSKGLQECLDNKQIAMGTAVHLSYLRAKEQKIIQNLLKKEIKIDAEQAKTLHKESESLETGLLSEEAIRKILESKSSPVKKRSIKFSEELFSKYFNEDQDSEEVEDTIAKALEFYRSQQEKD